MTPVAELVRRHDPDRYFCTLFAPARMRAALFTLFAFNHELARAQEVASAPALALIRLQWWREVAEGQRKRHEVAEPLLALIEEGALPRERVIGLVDARDDAVSAQADGEAAFLCAMRAGPGALAALAGQILGASADEQAALTASGAAYGMAGVLRNAAFDGFRDGAPPAHWVREQGLREAGRPRRWRREIIAAALPGVLARRDLLRPAAVRERGLADRLAVCAAAWMRHG